VDGGWIDWAPAITVNAGGTIGAVTVRLARWRRTGSNTVLIDLAFDAPVTAGAPDYFVVPLPLAGFFSKSAAIYSSGILINNGIEEAGKVTNDGGNNLLVKRLNNTAFSAGTCGLIGATVVVEIQ
jgi:hypothetical protein